MGRLASDPRRRNGLEWVPFELMDFLREHTAAGTFIETGTYKGRTAMWASERFSHVITIEADRELYENLDLPAPQVYSLFGPSEEQLNEVLVDLVGDGEVCMFWLDAHFQADGYGNGTPCPLLREISAANTRSPSRNIILIDDFSLFCYPYRPRGGVQPWPKLHEVVNALQEYELGVYGDALVALPPEHADLFFAWQRKIKGTDLDIL